MAPQPLSSASTSMNPSGPASTTTAVSDVKGIANRHQPTSNASSPLRHETNQRNSFACFINALTRKKPLDGRTDTSLNRCLNLLDLTTLGVGSTLGLGLYVLAGQVASNKAGPAVVISFGLAALASAFSALCYAEFAGRVPRAGSAYAYSYITVGEFVAFIIGWNLILEYVIGASSVARGFSGYLRFVFEHVTTGISSIQAESSSSNFNEHSNATATATNQLGAITRQSRQVLVSPSNLSLVSQSSHLVAGLASAITTAAPHTNLMGASSGSGASLEATSITNAIYEYVLKYFDWPSIVIMFVLTIFILLGVKESTNVTMVFTGINIIVVVTVVFSSFSSLNLHNWKLSKEELPPGDNYGEGGFMPYGWSGVLAGSATCFFGFIGFDTIASSAEEARNPKRNVPLSITLSLFISFVAYMAIATVQTLLWPYYDQDKITILPYIFAKLNMPITYWIVLLGAISGLASSQLGGTYPLPRILYSMAQDKLIYAQLAHINRKLKLPVRATIVGSIFVALLACLLDIEALADMVSIGTLAAYSLVSLSVLIIRYELRSDIVDDSCFLTSRLSFTDILSLNDNNLGQQTRKLNSASAVTSNNANTADQISTSFSFQTTKSRDNIEDESQRTFASSWLSTKQMLEQSLGGKPKTQIDGQLKRDSRLLDLLITWKSAENAKNNQPDKDTTRHSRVLISLLVLLIIILDLVALGLSSSHFKQTTINDQQHAIIKMINEQQYLNTQTILVLGGCIVFITLLAVVLMLSRLPTSKPTHPDMFMVPFVPVVPTLSIFVNTFLMLNLGFLTWVRFSVWMSLGFFIYFSYGIWNSEGYLLKARNNI